MNDGIFSRATIVPWMAPTAAQASSAAMIAAHHGQFAPVGCTSSATTTLLSAHDQADGQVDLAEEQGEDLGDRQQHVDGALLEQVDQVLRRQELRVRDLEADGDHHDGQEHGQDTGVAAADPEPRGPEVLAERLGEQLGRDVGRGGRGVEGKVGRPDTRPCRGLAGVRGHGHFLIVCPSHVVRHRSRPRPAP